MKNNGGNSLSKCQLVKTMSKARVRNTCNGEKRVVQFALCLSTGILVTFSRCSITHSHVIIIIIIIMGLFFHVIIIILSC